MTDEKFDYPTTIRVFKAEHYDGAWMPGNLAEAIAWLQNHLEAVPKLYRTSATIEIDSVGSWEDTHYAQITVEYQRPPTGAEIAQRIAIARARALHDLEWAKRRLVEEESRLARL